MGVLDTLTEAAAKVGSKMATAPNSEAEGIKATKQNVADYMNAIAKPSPTPKAAAPSDVDKINKTAKFGDKSGEKRMNVSDMTKPLPQYHKGTTHVDKTGPAILEKGEAVIPKHENPMADKTYDKLPGMADKPKKMIDHIKIRKAKGAHSVVEHHHTRPEHHPAESHVMQNMDQLHDHMEEHMGTPNPGEAEADAGQSGIPPAAGAPPAAAPPSGPPAAPGM